MWNSFWRLSSRGTVFQNLLYIKSILFICWDSYSLIQIFIRFTFLVIYCSPFVLWLNFWGFPSPSLSILVLDILSTPLNVAWHYKRSCNLSILLITKVQSGWWVRSRRSWRSWGRWRRGAGEQHLNTGYRNTLVRIVKEEGEWTLEVMRTDIPESMEGQNIVEERRTGIWMAEGEDKCIRRTKISTLRRRTVLVRKGVKTYLLNEERTDIYLWVILWKYYYGRTVIYDITKWNSPYGFHMPLCVMCH